MRRTTATLLTSMAMLLTMLAVVPTTQAGIQSTETCVTIFEGQSGTGDHWTTCSFTPTNLHNANLSGDTTGLHDGCSANWPLTNPDWNDCVSSMSYVGMPANYKLVPYFNANYTTSLGVCFDQDGSLPASATNYGWPMDNQISSWRVMSGSC